MSDFNGDAVIECALHMSVPNMKVVRSWEELRECYGMSVDHVLCINLVEQKGWVVNLECQKEVYKIPEDIFTNNHTEYRDITSYILQVYGFNIVLVKGE